MPLLLWSGGCDSTFLLAQTLLIEKDAAKKPRDTNPDEAPAAKAGDGYKIRTLTVVHEQIPAQQEQANARHDFITAMNKRGCTWNHQEVHITTKLMDNATFGVYSQGGLSQPGIWVPTAIPYLKQDEDLWLGYIKSDDAITYLSQITATFDNLKYICNKTGSVKYQLEHFTKAEIIYHLKRLKLYKHTWHCEGVGKTDAKKATKKPCHKCAPCMTHATALWQLQTGNNHALRHLPPLHALTKKLHADRISKRPHDNTGRTDNVASRKRQKARR